MNSSLTTDSQSVRCINVVNFIRGVEPRCKTDLLQPVREQMKMIKAHGLPATWLLQYDALVSGPFVEFLKENAAEKHEIGCWFEMNQMHCEAAGVAWRGRPGYEWDHLPPVAFTIGYTPEERIKLADTAMGAFKAVWGKYPQSVASWNLDSITMSHLVERYKVDAFAVCRDQLATDGFTIWGAPIAGYYPSKANCWSPAVERVNQIGSPVFRMLGQDPVYYYERSFPLPNGNRIGEPDTMEPVWTSGRSERFIRQFLDMIETGDTLGFSYAQLGQENSFPWDQMREAYPRQMEALAGLRKRGKVHVETMGETGRRFKRSFKTTPAQAQVMLDDPFANTDPSCGTVWFQNRFYRANLHVEGEKIRLRDITVYSDKHSQPYLREAARLNDVEQRMPSVLDSYHWKPADGRVGGFFQIDGQEASLARQPRVEGSDGLLAASCHLRGGKTLSIKFEERRLSARVDGADLALVFIWDSEKSALKSVEPKAAYFHQDGFDYKVKVAAGEATRHEDGWAVQGEKGRVALQLDQV